MTRRPTSTAASPFRVAKKVAVAVLGVGVLAFGVSLIALPVPGLAILVIPLGLAILATKFLWAKKLLDPTRKLLRRLKARAQRMFGKPSQPACHKAQP
jgi:tellurite resistance protein TerC